jgi:hypothetical protein
MTLCDSADFTMLASIMKCKKMHWKIFHSFSIPVQMWPCGQNQMPGKWRKSGGEASNAGEGERVSQDAEWAAEELGGHTSVTSWMNFFPALSSNGVLLIGFANCSFAPYVFLMLGCGWSCPIWGGGCWKHFRAFWTYVGIKRCTLRPL